MINNYKFGPLDISINGPVELVLEFAKDFEPKLDDSISCSTDIALTFESTDVGISETHYSGKRTLYFNNDEICFNTSQFYTAYVKGLFSEDTTTIRIIQKKQSIDKRALNLLKRAISLEYSTKKGQLRNHISNYSFLWAILSIKLMKKGFVFLHAGVFSNKEKTIVVTGTGGCGKTSTVINACRNQGFDFLSEDFGIVSRNGTSFYCPKTISLYKSDFKYYSDLERKVLSRLNLFSQLKWKILTKLLRRNPIIKVQPNNIFEKIALEGKEISNVYFFQRRKNEEQEVSCIELDLLIERVSWASYRELAPFMALLSGIFANKDAMHHFDSPEEVRSSMLAIYRSAFKESKNQLFSCYLTADPLEIMETLNETR
tara:strand:+ start:5597 stop:6712 length:1116 start_codon:yes stop_codon:yes gene_type:complete